MQSMRSAYVRILIDKLQTIIFIACVLFLLNVSISAFATRKEIVKKIEAIPLQDREILKQFFRKLLFFRGFAYTLFGDKPINIEEFDLENNQLFSDSSEGYEIWKKYAHLFPSQNYIFLFYENIDENFCELTLINKKAFRQAVEEHRDLFVKIFGSKVNSENLLNLIIRKRSLWNTPMKDHQDLIGILLGYGKTNAELFHQRYQINSKTLGINKRRTEPSAGYSTIEEEFETLNATLASFSDEGRFSFRYMRLPGFVVDPNSLETKKLKKKYAEQRRHITQKYAREDTLKIVLERLSLPLYR